MAIKHSSVGLLVCGLLVVAQAHVPGPQDGDEAQRLAARIRDRIAQSRAQIERYGYFEEDIEIQLDRNGREREREARLFAVSPAPPGGQPDARLLLVNGKPPSLDERDEDDERREHERTEAVDEAKEIRERRRQMIEDLRRGLVVRIAGRASMDGHQTTIVEFQPRPAARLQSRAGRFIEAMRGRVWVTANGDIVRAEAELMDDVSVGWGLIARIWKGSWLRGRQERHGDTFLPAEMTAEAEGRTLLFRTFRTRYSVRWWGYRLGASPQ